MDYITMYFFAMTGLAALCIALVCLAISKIVNYMQSKIEIAVEPPVSAKDWLQTIDSQIVGPYMLAIDDIFATVKFLVRERVELTAIIEKVDDYWNNCNMSLLSGVNYTRDKANEDHKKLAIYLVCKDKIRELSKLLINDPMRRQIIPLINKHWKSKASYYLDINTKNKEIRNKMLASSRDNYFLHKEDREAINEMVGDVEKEENEIQYCDIKAPNKEVLYTVPTSLSDDINNVVVNSVEPYERNGKCCSSIEN